MPPLPPGLPPPRRRLAALLPQLDCRALPGVCWPPANCAVFASSRCLAATWATSACKQAEASLRAALPASEPLSAAVLEGVQLSPHQRGALLRVMSELGAAQGPPAAAAASPHGPSACLEDSLPEGLEVFTQRSSDGTAPVHAIDLDREWREELAAHERRAVARASGRP